MAGRALIAGAGIGGLTAALALARAGFEAAIFERTAVLEEFGAGLQLTPNATRILARLGALEAIQGRALAPRAIRILRGRDGACLSALPLESAQKRWRAPYLVILRADLQRALVERLARETRATLTLGAEIGGLTSDEAGVTIGVKRGAIALHALRRSMDDDAFFDLVRSWTSTYRHGVVSTDDFLTLIGADAAAVLKPWLYEAKLPKLPAGRQRS